MSASLLDSVLDSTEVRLLNDIAMVGAGAGPAALAQTEQIFRSLMLLRPQRDFAYIGLACAFINQQRPDDAVRTLEQGLRIMQSAEPAAASGKTSPDLAMVQAFLALALLMAKRTAEAMASLHTLLATSDHAPARRMARGLLGLPPDEPAQPHRPWHP